MKPKTMVRVGIVAMVLVVCAVLVAQDAQDDRDAPPEIDTITWTVDNWDVYLSNEVCLNLSFSHYPGTFYAYYDHVELEDLKGDVHGWTPYEGQNTIQMWVKAPRGVTPEELVNGLHLGSYEYTLVRA